MAKTKKIFVAAVLTHAQVLQLAAKASVDPRTVSSVYSNKATRPNVRQRVVDAAVELKFPAPPKDES